MNQTRVTNRSRQLNPLRERFVVLKARDLFEKYYRWRQQHEGRALTVLKMLPVEPRINATEVLGLRFEEPYEIDSFQNGNRLAIELAGVMDRLQMKILVAHKFTPEIRRFTGAHEVGHYVLHPHIRSLRESPTTDALLRDPFRSPREREADRFAAELLMPRKILFQVFGRMFGSAVDRDQLAKGCALDIPP